MTAATTASRRAMVCSACPWWVRGTASDGAAGGDSGDRGDGLPGRAPRAPADGGGESTTGKSAAETVATGVVSALGGPLNCGTRARDTPSRPGNAVRALGHVDDDDDDDDNDVALGKAPGDAWAALHTEGVCGAAARGSGANSDVTEDPATYSLAQRGTDTSARDRGDGLDAAGGRGEL